MFCSESKVDLVVLVDNEYACSCSEGLMDDNAGL